MTGVPLAVSPAVRTPALYLLVNLTAGAAAPGTGATRCLLIAPKSASGTITPDTQLVEGVGGPDEVGTLLGVGTPGHLAAKAAFAEYGLLSLDVVAPVASVGVAATGTITFAGGPPTVSWDVTATIAGRAVIISWAAGESTAAGATKLFNAINLLTNDLPVVATNAVPSQVDLAAKYAGLWGNDITLRVATANGTGGTVTASGAKLSAGTLEPVLTNVLALVAGREYVKRVVCASNTDVCAAAASNVLACKTSIVALQTGANAKLQQMIYGCTATYSSLKTGTATMNFGPATAVQCENAESLPCELAGAEMGQAVREELLRPNCNRSHMPYVATLYGAPNIATGSLTDTQVEDALWYGISTCIYDSVGALMPARPLTTYYKDGAGNADDRVLDVPYVSGTYAVARDLRTAIPQQFPNASLSADIAPGEEPPPDDVVEVRDVRSFIDGRVQYYIRRGVVVGSKYYTARDNGTFVCRVNPTDARQLDVVLPVGIVPPWLKTSLVVNHVGPT